MKKASSKLFVLFLCSLFAYNTYAQTREERRDQQRNENRPDRPRPPGNPGPGPQHPAPPIPQPIPLPPGPIGGPGPHHPYPQPIPLPSPQPIPQAQVRQVAPRSLVTISVQQDIRYSGEVRIQELLVRTQGQTLHGAQIERVVVEGTTSRYGSPASVQVELNGRLVGLEKYMSPAQRRLPLGIDTSEEVRTLRLIVRGDARINTIHVRVGQVRPIHQDVGLPQRIHVNREVSSRLPLALAQLLPYETRLVESITIDARSRSTQAELALISTYTGRIEGSVLVSPYSSRQVIRLYRPMPLSELSLQSLSPVIVDSLEIELERGWSRY